MTESQVSDHLAKLLSGQREVPCRVGFIDILTDHEVIEVKHCRYWYKAIPQVLKYWRYYPDRQARIHLFGEGLHDWDIEALLVRCDNLGIKVSWHD